MIYVRPALNVPGPVLLPLVVLPSPQSMVNENGPFLFASLNLQLVE
jgi:hypothetical protein